MSLAAYVECIGEIENICKTLVYKPEEKEHLRDLYVAGRIILKLFFKNGV
jgi:hypothetical protein